MANVIKIKQGGTNVVAPVAGDLKKGELGYTFNNDKLWIGSGDAGTDEAIQMGGKLGSVVQAHDAGLDSIADLTTAANKMIYTTAADTYAVTALTATARTLLDDTSVSVMRTTLGVDASGIDNSTPVTLVESLDENSVDNNYLSLAGQAITSGTVPVSKGGTGAITAALARTALGVDASGIDNSTPVSLETTSHDYLSLDGQEVTLGTIDISDDTNLSAGTGVTLTAGTDAADDVLSVDYGTTASTACVGNDSRLATNLGYTSSTRVLTSSTGTSITLPLAIATVNAGDPSEVAAVAGLLSGADKDIIDIVSALVVEGSASTLIDTVQEVIAAFENHAEGLNLITELDAKLTAASEDCLILIVFAIYMTPLNAYISGLIFVYLERTAINLRSSC